MSNWAIEDSHAVLPPELADRLDEIITGSATSHYRATAILTLLRQMYEATVWLHDIDVDTDDRELSSLAELLAAAVDHQARMQVTEGPGRGPSRTSES